MIETTFEEQITRIYADPFCPIGCWVENVRIDQWWVVSVECPHGAWKAASHGPIDLGFALKLAQDKALKDHQQ